MPETIGSIGLDGPYTLQELLLSGTDEGNQEATLQLADALITGVYAAQSFDAYAVPRDCNDNGTPDVCDLANGESDDINFNGVPDECDCLPDIDGSGDVDFADLVAVLAAWGECARCPEDLDGNGQVDFLDILAILSGWD